MLDDIERRCKYFQSYGPFRGKCSLISDGFIRHIPDKCNDVGLGCAIREGQLQKDNSRLVKINQDYSEALDRMGLDLQTSLARISELEQEVKNLSEILTQYGDAAEHGMGLDGPRKRA